MVWFLSSSNRYLRDRTTKALIRLFEKRIPCLQKVLSTFHAVDDPYVIERLLAVAYGCTLRNVNPGDVGGAGSGCVRLDLSRWAATTASLLRDYARGVVEIALHRGEKLNIEEEKLRPPYRSDWPSLAIPTLEDLKLLGE